MDAPLDLFRANVSPGARLLAVLLWRHTQVTRHDIAVAFATVSRSTLREQLASPRGSLDRHIRELSETGWIKVMGDGSPRDTASSGETQFRLMLLGDVLLPSRGTVVGNEY